MKQLEHGALTLGEGPRWDASRGRLLLVDIVGGTIWHGTGLDHLRATTVAGTVGAVAPLTSSDDHVLGAVGTDLSVVDLRDGRGERIARLEPDRSDTMRANDGACDPSGRFVVGTMEHEARPGTGRLLRVDARGRVEELLDGCTIPNGLAWADDGATMLHIDSGPGTITAYPYGDGPLGPGRVVYHHTGPGTPDGMCRADDGSLLVAVWGGARILRLSPDGEVLAEHAVPAAQPTACCFAGLERRELVVTSATQGLEEPSAADGRSVVLDVGVSGEPARPFAG